MYAYVMRRIVATIPVMAVVGVFVFLLLHLTPGDPAAIIAGDYASPADIEKIRARLGLDQPVHVQFGRWVGHLAQGDLGGLHLLQPAGVEAHRPATRADPRALRPDHHPQHRHRGAPWRVRGVAGGDPGGPGDDGVRGARILGPHLRDRVHPDVRLRDRASLVPRPGLQADRGRVRAVPPEHRPAEPRPRHPVHRAHRPDLAGERARGADRGLHPDRAGKGAQLPGGAHAPRAQERGGPPS